MNRTQGSVGKPPLTKAEGGRLARESSLGQWSSLSESMESRQDPPVTDKVGDAPLSTCGFRLCVQLPEALQPRRTRASSKSIKSMASSVQPLSNHIALVDADHVSFPAAYVACLS